MREIDITQGYKAQVDDEDFERVSAFKWQANVRRRKDGTIQRVYVYRTCRTEGKHTQKLHRFILGISDFKVKVDHKDGNPLNCQKHNLRQATVAENTRNQRLHNSTGYKGVAWNITSQKWQAKLTLQHKPVHLGLFTKIEDSARAYDAAAVRLFGEFACTNAMLGLLSKMDN